MPEGQAKNSTENVVPVIQQGMETLFTYIKQLKIKLEIDQTDQKI